MSKYAIITDSASDLCKEYREANQVDYAQTMMSWKKEDGQEVETGASLDWDFISYKDFYNLLRGGTRVFTAQVTIQNYLDAFEPHLQKGEDILYIACSSGLSASLNTARMLAKVDLPLPERPLKTINESFGKETLIFLRLFSLAPVMTIFFSISISLRYFIKITKL